MLVDEDLLNTLALTRSKMDILKPPPVAIQRSLKVFVPNSVQSIKYIDLIQRIVWIRCTRIFIS